MVLLLDKLIDECAFVGHAAEDVGCFLRDAHGERVGAASGRTAGGKVRAGNFVL